jgi:hypothetical protein
MRPTTPLAVENGVGKPAAPYGAPNAGNGKESVRTGENIRHGKRLGPSQNVGDAKKRTAGL